MSEFINTIDLQGDQETLDALVSNTQTEYRDNGSFALCDHALRNRTSLTAVDLQNVTSIGQYVFNGCTGLTEVSLPSATSIGQYAFSGCTGLTEVSLQNAVSIDNYAFNNSSNKIIELKNVSSLGTYLANGYSLAGFDIYTSVTIPANAFNSCHNLSTLILRSNTMCPLSNVSGFASSPFSVGYGHIYVPASLVNTYKADSNWSIYASRIKSLNDYPLPYDGGTITDSWEEIFEAEEDETYSSKYSLGDIKPISLGDVCVPMQIVGFDTDPLSDDTGYARISWLSLGPICIRRMHSNNTASIGWKNTELRSYLNSVVYSNIELDVRNNIKSVHKYSYISAAKVTKNDLSDDYIWVPSNHELTGLDEASYESMGADYSVFFIDNSSRIKKDGPCSSGSTAQAYWVRSTRNTSQFYTITTAGAAASGYLSPSSDGRVVIGFCT